MFNFQRKVAENHGQSKIFQFACPGIYFVPSAFGIIHFGKNNVECASGNIGIFLISGSFAELSECHGGKGVGENIIGFHQRTSFACERKIPVQIAVMSIVFQKFCSLYGAV